MEACLAHNQEVGGSNPSSATQENLTEIKKAERRKQKKEVFTMTKMTYAQAIDNAINGNITDEVREKLEALKGQLAKRNSGSRKPSKVQVANGALKEDMWAYVSESGAKRANEVAIYFGISGQKASALLNALVKEGRLDKVTEKRVTYFRVAEGM